ncbi:Cytochrome oxidase assembly [Tulasnella sp. 419]|nr:Cytochrome oxidase assembly [Tulasnella sp. 419]
MAPEEEQRLNLRRRNFDKREEYFRLSAQSDADEEWEPRRIARPAGTPEWGLPPTSS